MKYKILITGKNNSIIDDFFSQMNNDFEVMTTSIRFDDIVRHLTYFEPDVLVYCIYNASSEAINQVGSARYRIADAGVPMIMIGSKEDCDEFEKAVPNVSSLILYRPISTPAIRDRIKKFLEEHQRKQAEKKKEEEREKNVLGMSLEEQSAELDKIAKELMYGSGAGADGEKFVLRKHVLVVDDNTMMLKLIKEYLHEKYDVATAVSGKIALKFLERRKTDLILLDYEMPGENGPAVLEQLRALEATKDIPVVFLTGVTETKKIQEALVLKPQSYLLKPVDRDKLLNTIAKLIGE